MVEALMSKEHASNHHDPSQEEIRYELDFLAGSPDLSRLFKNRAT